MVFLGKGRIIPIIQQVIEIVLHNLRIVPVKKFSHPAFDIRIKLRVSTSLKQRAQIVGDVSATDYRDIAFWQGFKRLSQLVMIIGTL